MSLKVLAPVNGQIVSLCDVKDEAFSSGMLGEGAAVKPADGTVVAPVSGAVTNVHRNAHAYTITTDCGAEVLIHIATDTVSLNGQGFKAFVKRGDKVAAGDKIAEFDLEYVKNNAPQELVIVVVSETDAEAADYAKGEVKAGKDAIFALACQETAAAQEAADGCVTSQELTVPNKHGYHARPAGVLAATASKFKSEIEVCTQFDSANAKSMVAIMGLGIEYNDVITITATGPDAKEAVATLTEEIKNGLNEEDSDAPAPQQQAAPAAQQPVHVEDIDFAKETLVQGQSASSGLVMGKVFIWQEPPLRIPTEYKGHSEERDSLSTAVQKAKEQLLRAMEAAKDNHAEILNAHIGITQDPFLMKHAQKLIEEGTNAANAWIAATDASIRILEASGAALIKERIADYKDVERRVVMAITGQRNVKIDIPQNSIVFAEEFLPYHLALFDSHVKGVVSAWGSPTAHVSIMLRNVGLPAVVSAGDAVMKAPNGLDIVLDATHGEVVFNPGAELKQTTEQKINKLYKDKVENQKKAFEPAITLDGLTISVEGNVGTIKEAEAAAQNGADGLGLVRTEFLFSKWKSIPTEEEQYDVYQKVLDAMKGKHITIRTFDVGGDKPFPYMTIPKEENPIVGLRGVRNYKGNIELFKNQVRALLRVKPQASLQVMVPMIGFVDEYEWCKQVFEEEKASLGIKEDCHLGMMIEVPSAAIMAQEFAKRAAFFSIGTNDLAQYTLAIDRGHNTLSRFASNLNPAVLKMIQFACSATEAEGKVSGVCGAMASEMHAIPVLIGLGVKELAVTAASIADIKALIRTLDAKKCKEVAEKALKLSRAEEVRELIEKEFGL